MKIVKPISEDIKTNTIFSEKMNKRVLLIAKPFYPSYISYSIYLKEAYQ